MAPRSRNLFADIPAELPRELVEILADSPAVTIERIVSRGHASPDNFWYDQDKNEFVILLSGRAEILFQDAPEATLLAAGDYLYIPARCRHRVQWTDPKQETVWLAVHY